MSDWKRLSESVRVTSQWVTLIGERWLCDKGKELEYWRVEKADSVIVLPIQAGHIVCVAPTFRPGIGRATLDLPGSPAAGCPQTKPHRRSCPLCCGESSASRPKPSPH